MTVTVYNPQKERLTLEIFDINGQRIEILANNLISAVNDNFEWNSSQKNGNLPFQTVIGK